MHGNVCDLAELSKVDSCTGQLWVGPTKGSSSLRSYTSSEDSHQHYEYYSVRLHSEFKELRVEPLTPTENGDLLSHIKHRTSIAVTTIYRNSAAVSNLRSSCQERHLVGLPFLRTSAPFHVNLMETRALSELCSRLSSAWHFVFRVGAFDLGNVNVADEGNSL